MKNNTSVIENKNTKYIFVVGGVISGVGKGITTSSLAYLYKNAGYKVDAIKIDPYVNIDAGTMNPVEHGEVFVLSDGDECDQDMGNYERFLNQNMSRDNYITTGRVYKSVLEKERSMYYKGKCVQVVPDIPNEVIGRIEKIGKENDIVFIEIGGTVGEYENILFLEAVRSMKMKYRNNIAVVLVSYVPEPESVGEAKTKPTQHAVRSLNGAGLYPDMIIARSKNPLDKIRKEKLSLFCSLEKNRIISAPDVASIYDIPVNFHKEKVDVVLAKSLDIKNYKQKNITRWKKFFAPAKQNDKILNIAIVGKYFSSGDGVLKDAYVSIFESVKYAAYENNYNVNIEWVSAEDFEIKKGQKKSKQDISILTKYDGIVVPGGFGSRGVEGIINSIKYVRENKMPFLGICYGMQLAVIEYARNVLKLKDAHTTEVNSKTKNPIVTILKEQKEKLKNGDFGNSMRLGNYIANVKSDTLAHGLYKKREIIERHRHRYEVDPSYHSAIENEGMIISGLSPDGRLAEVIELRKDIHPYFIASQYHPEFASRTFKSSPLFSGLIKSAILNKK
jgi:CTP synthase